MNAAEVQSLIQAGLIPRLLQTPNWSALVMRPGVDALARLADVLVTVDRDPQRPAPDRDDAAVPGRA